ncbi:MAG: hypothetical protein HC892_10745 [Saprospiraceae bacterium]|nr:hypothetical protein [Saprospiraceae bacterium]
MKNILVLSMALIIYACYVPDKPVMYQLSEQEQARVDSLKLIQCDIILTYLRKSNLDTVKQTIQIPNTFQESLCQLDTLINKDMKEWIKCLPDQYFNTYVHRGLGMYFRNKWNLWGNSVLAEEFCNMGITHPDDMSSIILISYQRLLKGDSLRLQEQIKYHQDFWADKAW